jgi:ATP adenylyltransferase/5',5'''-P-1,P-4-tetraphosphate phosphorylase II
MININQKVKALFNEQVSNWELVRRNFESLKTVQTKSFNFGEYDVKVQFNPGRIVSSGAKVDAKTIAERKCFLCSENRPTEQHSIEFGSYEILLNPFPIFPEHFTIAQKKHVPQQILPYLADMLQLARAMDNYLIFYNGPQCGASAPDHMHFQAGTKNFLPLVNDYYRLRDTHTELLVSSEHGQLLQMINYGRKVYVIESVTEESAIDSFIKTYNFLKESIPNSENPDAEPMMNIVCTYNQNKWNIFVIPRKAFRPRQYSANDDSQLLVSPATVEMCGIFICPIESHFNKITANDIRDIFNQVSE